MLLKFLTLSLTVCVLARKDKPCAAKNISGQSVVCVCNATYCDELHRSLPTKQTFYVYTTSESGLRFKKVAHTFKDECVNCNQIDLVLDLKRTYQKIQGFGGAVTDAAGINWKSLNTALRKLLTKSYYSKAGLEYNMARVPIGGCDFSTHPYAYNELPVNDKYLSNFTLSPEDYKYRLPLLSEITKTSKVPVNIVATTWSPPPWMKTNNAYTGVGQLKKEYYQTYADYHLKFIEKLSSKGFPIWGITTTNEPTTGLINAFNFNSLGWTSDELGKWIVGNLGPTIKKSKYKNVKIMTCDDQRNTIKDYFIDIVKKYPKALKYIDGIAVHYYSDGKFAPHILDEVAKTHPEKFILCTEASEGTFNWEKSDIALGSWRRAKTYIRDIIKDMNHHIVGWLDWNLCLNPQGGPNWANNYVDSPIAVFADKQEFYKEPMYYALAHFTKFIPRNSIRIKVKSSTKSVESVAFLTPRNTVVLVLFNDNNKTSLNIKYGGKTTKLNLIEKSITTVEFLHEKS
ncbi:lysosomal acid glucosylceramidase-like isoform X1 [Leptidea sinapis]|uniref:lysosomal acid glucosylceramidase-like isoform X1 n=1 Tax=Leptidea sinapis TaxID=189913 RepID=UPI0021421D43|nr:lysosomal acid glucosylceramidase-like isoform X1 [Leptidea sinapis]